MICAVNSCPDEEKKNVRSCIYVHASYYYLYIHISNESIDVGCALCNGNSKSRRDDGDLQLIAVICLYTHTI